MTEAVQEQTWKIEALEQYSRRDYIKLYGIPPAPLNRSENVNDIVIDVCKKMDVNIDDKDSVSHQLPRKLNPIIVKFVHLDTTNVVVQSMSKLKDCSESKLFFFVT